MIAFISGGLGAAINGVFSVKGKGVEAVPNVIEQLSRRITDQETRMDELTHRLSVQQMEIEHWKGAYFRLLRWLKDLFRTHSINEEVPEFHLKDDDT